MRKICLVAATFVGLLVIAPIVRADLNCPTGSLSNMLPANVWTIYVNRNSEHVNRWLRRLAENLAKTVQAPTSAAQIEAAARAGDDNGRVMTRMFEEGFIAATDIVYAHCSKVPTMEPWSENIKQMRRQKWCKEWPDAHFCPRR